jgi:ankyrin repeat protein
LLRRLSTTRGDIMSEEPKHYGAVLRRGLLVLAVALAVAATVFVAVYRNECLFHAARWGKPVVTRFLLFIGADVNCKGLLGASPLMAAASSGDVETTQLLLDSGADVNAATVCNDTALIFASQEGHMEIVKLLLRRGADVNAQMSYGFTSLSWAALNGQLEVVKTLVDRGAHLYPRPRNALMPLTMAAAAYEGIPLDTRLGIMKVLIANGADVNAEDDKGQTALMRTSLHGRAETAKFLKDSGADLHPRLNSAKNALVAASVKEHLRTLAVLLEDYRNGTCSVDDVGYALIAAKHKGCAKAVEAILEHCGQVRLEMCKGSPSLSELFANNYEEVLEFLVNQCGPEARHLVTVALLTALEAGDVRLAQWMIDKRVDANSRLGNGWTPLMSAVRTGKNDEALVKLLLDNGADRNARTHDGTTALTLAASSGSLPVLKLLLLSGAEVDPGRDGNSRALTAARNRLERLSRYYRCAQAAAGQRDQKNDEARNVEEMVQLLEKQVQARDAHGTGTE